MTPTMTSEEDGRSIYYGSSESSTTEEAGLANKKEEEEEEEAVVIARNETRHVRQWRALLVAVLLLSGAGICTGTYLFLHNKTVDDYELSFHVFANAIEDSVEFHVENLEEAIEGLSDTIAAQAGVFPFVSLNKFEVYGDRARHRSGIEVIIFTPLVKASQKDSYEEFAKNNQGWVQESRRTVLLKGDRDPVYLPGSISPFIYHRSGTNGFPEQVSETVVEDDLYAPVWHMSPPPFNPAIVNFDVFSIKEYERVLKYAVQSKGSAFSAVLDVSKFSGDQLSDEDHLLFHEQFTEIRVGIGYDHPHSLFAQPVFDASTKDVIGLLFGALPWDFYLVDLLPEGVNGVICVLRNSCGQSYTYELNGGMPTLIGDGDLHDKTYDDLMRRIPVITNDNNGKTSATGDQFVCHYHLDVYPSATFEKVYSSKIAVIAAVAVGSTFFLVVLIFAMYDRFVGSRNEKVVASAKRSQAMISSLFPSTVRKRIYEANTAKVENDTRTINRKTFRLSNSLHDDNFNGKETRKTKPIADLFSEATVMFADIAGFTAWSSAREPCAVFELLETIYGKFDELAQKRKIFKVETIGDCYLAVAGLPEPRKDHHIAMARFARDCLNSFQQLTQSLERELGPDTTDLAVRIGLHSGPVTAGVLRGDRARFQLFGDTVNTAARMESNGRPGRIQISQETAKLLSSSGKQHWVTPREDRIYAKGKGELQTFWLDLRGDGSRTSTSSGSGNEENYINLSSNEASQHVCSIERPGTSAGICRNEKQARLVAWNTDVLSEILREIVARRKANGAKADPTASMYSLERSTLQKNHMILEEVTDIIVLPSVNAAMAPQQIDAGSIDLDQKVTDQLHNYVEAIAELYNNNSFHCFEHACHVAMSVGRLQSRIVAPDIQSDDSQENTFGITSPLTKFIMILAALIHDVDHPGVPNAQLVKEKAKMAEDYKNKSIAEQHSVELAWNLLMEQQYSDLRRAIYSNEAEFNFFRQLLLNAVMATDIMDAELGNARKSRWNKAFAEGPKDHSGDEEVGRKATIFLEHLIQASDVAHTMQHWHIYRKWNSRLFTEQYVAFVRGRADTDPAISWYNGELDFFDFYIIPLALKLQTCGVFGVASDTYLNYARQNREEWAKRGKDIVEELVESVKTLQSDQVSIS